MFSHIFKYRLKCLLRNKEMLFWALMFPLVLSLFYKMAFSNLGSAEAFKPIDVGVADDAAYRQDAAFSTVLEKVSTGEGRLFNLTVTSREEAEKLLKENAIKGYIVVESPISLVVNQSGLSQNIIRNFIGTYVQMTSTATTILSEDPSKQQQVVNGMNNRKEFVKAASSGNAAPDTSLIYFYSLIAMACFYGGFYGSNEVTDIQADISPRAARINAAPVHKLKVFLYSASASFLIHFVEMLVLFLFLIFALGVDFGAKTGLVLLTLLLGSVAGVSFGAFISALVKKSESVKIALLISTTMLGSALAGLMFSEIKYVVAKYVPILSWINPISLLADALYSLYYYDTLTRFSINLAALSVFTAGFCAVTYFTVRRRKYASL